MPTAGTSGTIQNTDAGNDGYLSTNGNIQAGSVVEKVALVTNVDGSIETGSTVEEVALVTNVDGSIETGSTVEECCFSPCSFFTDSPPLVTPDDGQVWERSTDDDSGYFTLKNIKSGKFLNGCSGQNPPNRLTIEGTYWLICLCVFFYHIVFFYL